MDQTHAGRVAIVTGARRGIGQEIAIRLARCGARLVLVDLEPCSETAAAIDAEALDIVADVSVSSEWARIAADTVRKFGSLDIVVNNAGIGRVAIIDDVDEAEWRRTMAVNLDAHFFSAKHCVAPMRKNGWGRFVNISSNSIGTAHTGLSYYMASKMGVIGFVRGLANDLAADGITVNAVLPSLTDTPGTAAMPESFKQSVWQLQAIKRFAQPADIAGPVVFLTSDDARFVTGQSIVADGGLYKIS